MIHSVQRAVAALIFCGLASADVDQAPLGTPALSSGLQIPLLGFGTWNVKGNTSDVVSAALQAGYRHIDCAKAYGNQVDVGKGLKDGAAEAGLKREDYWVTSKLWNDRHRPDQVAIALNETLTELGLDYLDLYLIHWPVSVVDGKAEEDFVATWQAMSLLLATGHVKHIGVCNFSPPQLRTLLASPAGRLAPPYNHQMELHPYLPQDAFVDWHKAHDITVTAYSPFGNMNPTYDDSDGEAIPPLLKNKVLVDIAEKRGCTPAQVALKWGYIRSTATIPKSAHLGRIKENLAATECELKDEDLHTLREELPTKRFSNPSARWGVPLFEGLDGVSGLRMPELVRKLMKSLSG